MKNKIIKKVRYKAGKVHIWVQAHEKAKDASNFEGLTLKSQCNSTDEPRNAFKAAFVALSAVALQAMKTVDSWSDCTILVYSVRFLNKEDKLVGVVFEGKIWITKDSAMMFQTPVVLFEEQEDKECITLPTKSFKIVETLFKETEKYFSGERAQVEMVLEEKAA